MTQTINILGKMLEWTSFQPEAPQDSRPPIIMLHEGLGSVAMWRGFPQKLANAMQTEVFVYSRFGYGESDPAELPRNVDYMHREAQQVLPAFINALSIDKPVLLGHSDGGSISLIAAGARDIELSGVIVMASHIFVEDLTIRSIAEAKVAWQTTDLSKRLGRYHQNVENAFRGWNDIWLNPDFLTWNIQECLSNIDCPLLAIQGEDDQYGTMAQMDGIESAVQGSQLVRLKDCAHSPHKDQPDAVLQACQHFYRERVIQ